MILKADLSTEALDRMLQQIRTYTDELQVKAKKLCEQLAYLGATGASLGFSQAFYVGNKDFSVSVEETEGGYNILANGDTILFLEFGAGIKYGYGHPLAGDFGYGPGTYPPTDPKNPHWDDPNGWYIPGGEKSYGNPPHMPMYNAAQEIKREVERVAREVFSS